MNTVTLLHVSPTSSKSIQTLPATDRFEAGSGKSAGSSSPVRRLGVACCKAGSRFPKFLLFATQAHPYHRNRLHSSSMVGKYPASSCRRSFADLYVGAYDLDPVLGLWLKLIHAAWTTSSSS